MQKEVVKISEMQQDIKETVEIIQKQTIPEIRN